MLRLGSYALTPKTFLRPELAEGINETYELRVGNEILQVQIRAGEIDVRQGPTWPADAVFRTDILTYLALLQHHVQPDEALSRGLLRVEGDPAALDRFLNICGLPHRN